MVEASPRRQARGRRPRQAPPAAGVAAAFSTAHVLDDDGRTCRACRCSASAATRTAWLAAPCWPLVPKGPGLLVVPDGGPLVQVGGQEAGASHKMVLLDDLGVWQCAACGFFAPVGGRALGAGLVAACPPEATPTGAEYLRRTARGPQPKPGRRAARPRVIFPVDTERDAELEAASAART